MIITILNKILTDSDNCFTHFFSHRLCNTLKVTQPKTHLTDQQGNDLHTTGNAQDLSVEFHKK